MNNYILTQSETSISHSLGNEVPINELIHVEDNWYFSEISESKAMFAAAMYFLLMQDQTKVRKIP